MINDSKTIKICVICSPSFSRCFNPIMIQGNALSHFVVDEDEYISLLQERVASLGLPWLVQKDDTYANATELQNQGFDILLAIPGLRLMFARRGFNKNKVIHLDYFSYVTKDVNVSIKRINDAINADS